MIMDTELHDQPIDKILLGLHTFLRTDQSYPKRHQVVRSGQYCEHLYYVKQGALKQYYIHEGREIVFRLLIEGDFCGSAYALLTGESAFEYIETVEACVLVSINYPELQAAYQTDLGLCNIGRQLTESYFVAEQQRAISLHFKTPQDRYIDFLAKKPAYANRFNLGTIASYLGMTQETLSRLRASLF